jgi:hypothetical protein
MANQRPKILLLDIETRPTLAYVWRLYDENVAVEQIVEPTRMICWAAKWAGESEVVFAAEWGGRARMVRTLHSLISKADAVITYNGDKFDLPKINGEFLLAGLPPAPPIPSIDLYKTVKRLGFASGKLAFVAPLLKIGEKVKHAGFRLWREVMDGLPAARAEMERYNKQDTRLLDKLYRTLRPYIKSHPYLGTGIAPECPACGSKKVQKRGVRRTKSFFVERLHCQDCGSWSDGVRTKAGKSVK